MLQEEIQNIIVYRRNKTTGEFTRITTVTDYEAFKFERLLTGVGNFEFTMDLDSRNAALIKEWDFIQIGTQSDRQGIIRKINTRVVLLDGVPVKEIKFSGTTLNTILESTMIYPPTGSAQRTFVATPIETIIKTTFSESRIANTIQTNNNIVGMQVVTDQGRGLAIDDVFRYNKASTEYRRLAEASGIGFYIFANFSAGTLNFDTIHGEDRSIDNTSGNDEVRLSIADGNVSEIEYTKDGFIYRNHAIIGGSGSGSTRTIRYIDEETADDPWSLTTYVDAREQTTNEGLDDAGYNTLAAKARTETIEIRTTPNINSEVDSSFFLGDTVSSVIPEIGIIKDFQIVGITEDYSRLSGFNYALVLGNKPSLVEDAIMEQLNKSDKVTVE